MNRKRNAFSMSEALVTLGLIGILAITMVSMNNFAGYNSKEAITKLSQVDNALQTWGKALSQSNETGMGATANIGSQGNLNDSVANFFNTRGQDADVALKTDASVGETLNGATKFTLDNGVELSVKYLGEMNSNGVTLDGAEAYSRNNSLSNIAYVTATVQDKKASYAQEYVLNAKGLENADAQFEGWAKYKVNRDMYIVGKDGEHIPVVGYCTSSECQAGGKCGAGCTQLNDDFEGEYIYENTTGTEPCPSGQNGSILIKQIGTVAGVYDFKDDQCCPAPKVRVNGECACPEKAAMVIKTGWGYESSEATCQRQCAKGEYSLNGVCTLCTEANYCPNESMTSPFECQAGHYCPNFDNNKVKDNYNERAYKCDENGENCEQVSKGGLTEQKECQPGTYQPDKNQLSCKPCEQGYYCPDSGMTKQIPCPAGTYHDPEDISKNHPEWINTKKVCQPCPKDTYQPNTGVSGERDNVCKPCPDGSWTEDVGATTCTTCPAGTLFDATNQQCVPCPVGHYCPNPGMKVGEEIACECGKYQPKTGQTECLVVPAGTYPTMGGTPANDRTPATWVTSGATHAQLCPKGYLCLGGCPLQNKPTECSAGYYQPNMGKAECLPCPCGEYQNDTGAISCKNVAAGRYPAVGTTYVDSAATNNPTCPAGSYCTGGCNNKRACTSGFSYAGWASCHTCPTTWYAGILSVGTYDVNNHTSCRCNGIGSWTFSASDDYDVAISLRGSVTDAATGGSATFTCSGVIHYRDPIILDLLGNGIKLTTPENGVMFDLVGDGNPVQTAWTDVQTEFDDAFLARDLNNNGKIDDINELFGDTNGSKNGFQELAKYDDNKDGIINKDDSKFGELLLWADMNKDGITDEGELKTLADLNITEIATNYETEYDDEGNIKVDENENQVGMTSWFKQVFETVVDGVTQLVEKIGKVFDVFFKSL